MNESCKKLSGRVNGHPTDACQVGIYPSKVGGTGTQGAPPASALTKPRTSRVHQHWNERRTAQDCEFWATCPRWMSSTGEFGHSPIGPATGGVDLTNTLPLRPDYSQLRLSSSSIIRRCCWTISPPMSLLKRSSNNTILPSTKSIQTVTSTGSGNGGPPRG